MLASTDRVESVMASADVLRQPAAQPSMPSGGVSFKPIIQPAVARSKTQDANFDPKQHLAFQKPEQVVMMRDIGYRDDTGVSPVAVSQPFRLFSDEAVEKFREEVLSEEVMSKCTWKSNLAACQVRGYAPKQVTTVAFADWIDH